MELFPVQVKTLLFVLRDVASKAELDQQFPDGHAADYLVAIGLLNTHAGFYSITSAGRKVAAAHRRDAAAEIQIKPVSAYVAKSPETISINKSLDIAALSTPQSGLFKAPIINEKVNISKGKSMNAVVEKSRSLKVLEYLEAHPKSDSGTVAEAVEVLNPMAYIKTNISLGEVVFEQVGNKRLYSIAHGLKAADIHRGGEKAIKPKDVSVTASEKTDEYQIPAFLRRTESTETGASNDLEVSASAATEELQFELPGAPEDTFSQAQAETRKDIEKLQRRVKFAYTDDHTMLIIEHDKQPFELDAQATKRLLDFANEISMVAVV